MVVNAGLIDRRNFALGVAGSSLVGCATTPPLLINLADLPPPARAGVDDIARAGTGADLAGRLTVPVLIEGRGPYSFVVDTGANRTVISEEIADELQLVDAGPADVHGIAGVEPTRTVIIQRLEIDTVVATHIRAPTLPASRLGAAGLLGVDMMIGRLVTLDFRRGELRIERSRGDAAPSSFNMRQSATGLQRRVAGARGVAAPARYRFGQLVIVGADVQGRRIMAFLDSGSQSTVGNLALRDRMNASGRDLRGPRYDVSLLSATGQTASGEYGVLPLLRLGGLDISGLGAVFSDLHVFDLWGLSKEPSVLIGVDVLRQFDAIELDYGGRRIVFYPSTASAGRR